MKQVYVRGELMKTVYVDGVREMEAVKKALKQLGYRYCGSASGKVLYSIGDECLPDGSDRIMIINRRG